MKNNADRILNIYMLFTISIYSMIAYAIQTNISYSERFKPNKQLTIDF
jgi:hypothetical protein